MGSFSLKQGFVLCCRGVAWAIIVGGSILTTGCSGAADEKRASQIVAKVNAEEVSVHQLNNQLAQQGMPDSQEAVRRTLDRLIDRTLLVQQSRNIDLDRGEQVIQAIEESKRDIIARAYVDSVVSRAVAATENELQAFYDEKPALFSGRRIYTVREISIGLGGDDAEVIELNAKVVQTLIAQAEQLLDKTDLQANAAPSQREVDRFKAEAARLAVPVKFSVGVKAAEELPLDLLDQFFSMAEGDVGVVKAGSGALVFHIMAVLPAPLSFDEAKPSIERILLAEQQARLIESDIKRLRGLANIEYLGEFTGDPVASTTVPDSLAQRSAPQ